MRIGFTGTRYGMSPAQKATVTAFLKGALPVGVEHGDCVGADADFHKIVRSLFTPQQCPITVRPGPGKELRAFCDGDAILPPKSHFARNRDIVDHTDLLVATPMFKHEQSSGGTWYTINYARKCKKKRPDLAVFIVWPDGLFNINSV